MWRMRFQEVDSTSNCHSERSEASIVWNGLTRLSAAGRNFTNTLYGQIDAFYKEKIPLFSAICST
jgi:hypothetical protein